ncbi:MAG TPA: hypothetical protein VK395_20070 [Gemmataceae bacterium]|nr:hypothetical protein [Gemmataceae bacterium]
MQIQDLVSRRTDLSTFLVHLTRAQGAETAKQRLISILKQRKIVARSPFGPAIEGLKAKGQSSDSQRCACFTETPLEYTHLLLGEIEGRDCQFEPYGVAITKKQGRRRGVNPIWYVDITPGHDWLMNSINPLIKLHLNAQKPYETYGFAKITPFIEQMGSGAYGHGLGGGYKKEFWWEREWRHLGDFDLPGKFIVLCPLNEILEIKEAVNQGVEEHDQLRARCIDPRWGLEKIIGHLAGFDIDDLGPL